jgi:hypothetical protein
MMWRDGSARASPAGLPSFAQKNGHSLTQGSRSGSHARNASRQVTRLPDAVVACQLRISAEIVR